MPRPPLQLKKSVYTSQVHQKVILYKYVWLTMLKTLNIQFLHEHRERLGVQSPERLFVDATRLFEFCVSDQKTFYCFSSAGEKQRCDWAIRDGVYHLFKKLYVLVVLFPSNLSLLSQCRSPVGRKHNFTENKPLFLSSLKDWNTLFFLVFSNCSSVFFSSKPEVTYMNTIFFFFYLFLVLTMNRLLTNASNAQSLRRPRHLLLSPWLSLGSYSRQRLCIFVHFGGSFNCWLHSKRHCAS